MLRNASKTDSIKRHAGGGYAAGSTVQTDHKNQYDLSQFDYNEYKKPSSAGHAACLLPTRRFVKCFLMRFKNSECSRNAKKQIL